MNKRGWHYVGKDKDKGFKLECPRCKSAQVITTAKNRWCRRCGYRTENKQEFEA